MTKRIARLWILAVLAVGLLACNKQEEAPVVTGADASGDFSMEVEDVFEIEGRGIVVTGTIASGTLRSGDTVTQLRGGVVLGSLLVSGIEQFQEELSSAKAGDKVGLRVNASEKGDLQRGDVLSKTTD